MKTVTLDVINRGNMSSYIDKSAPETVELGFMSSSEDEKFLLARNGIYYFVFQKLSQMSHENKDTYGTFIFLCAEKADETDSDYVFKKFFWEKNYGFVELCFGNFPKKFSHCRKIIFDEHLYDTTMHRFFNKYKTGRDEYYDCSRFECNIQNETLDKLLPAVIREVLCNDLVHVYKDEEFSFNEYPFLEINTFAFLETKKKSFPDFGRIYNTWSLYKMICNAYGVNSNSNATFHLVFTFDDEGKMRIMTSRINGR